MTESKKNISYIDKSILLSVACNSRSQDETATYK